MGLPAFDEIRHGIELRRKRMPEATLRRLAKKRLGDFTAGEVLALIQEIGRARAVEREARGWKMLGGER